MPASFLHGVEVIELVTGPAPITVVKSSVIGLVGTAPYWAVSPGTTAAGINTPHWLTRRRTPCNLVPRYRDIRSRTH